jgi:hypothetical protein
VKSGDWKHTIEIDSDIFDDPYTEACTRAVETIAFKNKKINISCILFCWLASDKQSVSNIKSLNSYKILINAGLHTTAEKLREELIKMTGHDWANEPLTSKK